MTKSELIAEITSDFRQYDEANLIDYRSLNLWIRTELRRFGNNIMVPTEKTLTVDNSKATLPDNFWRLLVAAKCDDAGYRVCEGKKEHIIMNHFWRERTEQSYEWDTGNDYYYKTDFKEIKEKVYFEGGAIEFRYSNPTLLRLTRSMRREVCHSSCKNLQQALTSSSPYEINILGETLQTNFKRGYIYIQYMGLPTDDNGELIIPDTQLGHLQKYLTYYCKMRILENLIGNEDDPQKRQDLAYFKSRADETFSLAMTESKFEGLGRDWDTKLKNAMRKNTLKYELMFPIK